MPAKKAVALLKRPLVSVEMIERRIYLIRGAKSNGGLGPSGSVSGANKIADIEGQQHEHGRQLTGVYTMVRRLMMPPRGKKRPIGFRHSQ
jgi:hypothetical protein